MKKPLIVVWFSCGAASAVAAKLTIDKYSDTHEILIVNNPVDEEDEDNLRFKNDVSKWLNYPIIEARNNKLATNSAYDIWEQKKFMSGVQGAPCTMLLKKEARYQFELTHNIDFHVLGFTVDEKHRFDRFKKFERSNILPILIEANLSKTSCFDVLTLAKVKLPRSYKHFKNANCDGCVKASSPTYWNTLRKVKPDVYLKRAEQSRRLGVKLVKYKGERIFLDELPINAKGGKLETYECGIFCDTK